jgi:hypothetical protein
MFQIPVYKFLLFLAFLPTVIRRAVKGTSSRKRKFWKLHGTRGSYFGDEIRASSVGEPLKKKTGVNILLEPRHERRKLCWVSRVQFHILSQTQTGWWK